MPSRSAASVQAALAVSSSAPTPAPFPRAFESTSMWPLLSARPSCFDAPGHPHACANQAGNRAEHEAGDTALPPDSLVGIVLRVHHLR
nr:hypothetical protein CFP56_33631 [Quercus suber]